MKKILVKRKRDFRQRVCGKKFSQSFGAANFLKEWMSETYKNILWIFFSSSKRVERKNEY